MKKIFFGLFLATVSSVSLAQSASVIVSNRNCDLVVESTGVNPLTAGKIKDILRSKGFRLVEDHASAQNAEFAYNSLIDRNGPIPVSVSVNILRKIGSVEFIYVNGDDVGFPHFEHRALSKIVDLVKDAPRCQLRF